MVTEGKVIAFKDYYTARAGYLDIDTLRKTLKAYEAGKWVEFDTNDESTHPPAGQYLKGSRDRLLMAVNGETFSGCYDLCNDRPTFTDENDNIQTPTHWQPLPEFKE